MSSAPEPSTSIDDGPDLPYRRFVQALWRLLQTAVDPAAAADDLTLAADLAAAAGEAAMHGESHLLLQERHGALFANGVRLRLCVGAFSAQEGLAECLRRQGVGELLFEAGMQAGALLALAGCYAGTTPAQDDDPEAILQRHGVVGIHASRRDAAAGTAAPWCGRRSNAPMPDAGSQLRSVFLHHELVVAYGATGVVPRARAHIVLQAVADRLLREPAGLEPLLVLQQEASALEAAVHVCVLAAVIGRAAGCPDGLLGEVAVAALCHDVGRSLAPTAANPAVTGCRWLLQRGRSALWLRCGLVARSVGGRPGDATEELPGDGALAAAIVALAVELDRRLRQGRQSPDAALAAVRDCCGNGGARSARARWHPELVAAASAALAEWSGDDARSSGHAVASAVVVAGGGAPSDPA